MKLATLAHGNSLTSLVSLFVSCLLKLLIMMIFQDMYFDKEQGEPWHNDKVAPL